MTRTAPMEVATFLPDVALASATTNRVVPLRAPMGETTVAICVHSSDCSGCLSFVDQLASSQDEFRAWDARMIVVLPDKGTPAISAPFAQIARDPDRIFARGSVIVADRYGQIFHSHHAGATHDFPPPREIEEWLKFLGTLCPE